MIVFLVLLAVMALAGLGVFVATAAVLAVAVRAILWLVFLPFRLIFWLLAIPFFLLKLVFVSVFALVFGLATLIILPFVAFGLFVGIVVPLLPLALIGFGIWTLVRQSRRPVAARA